MRSTVRHIWGIAAAVALASCGTADRTAISEEERRAGAELHPQLLAEFGGAYTGDETTYVTNLGRELSAAAGLSDGCTFTVVNTDVVNAFAVPGCYIYVTRGLLAIVDSEAELAAVLAHELGHIAADHGERQEQRTLWRSLGVAAVAALSGSEDLARFAGRAAALFTLRYSRKHEYEADDLGLQYLREAGYDPFAAADMLRALRRHEAYQERIRGVEDAKSIPEWALTHPMTERRMARVEERAAELGASRDQLPEKELAYLKAVDGLLYGDDPAQGFVIGRRFAHPVMRIGFEAPPGFTLTNSPQEIMIEGPEGIRGSFSGGRVPPGGLPAYAEAVLQGTLGQTPIANLSSERAQTNGGPGLFVSGIVPTAQGELAISLAVYGGPDGSAYHFLVVSPPDDQVQNAIAALFRSFRFLDEAEVNALKARRIRVKRVQPGQTPQELAVQSGGAATPALISMLNGLEPGEPLRTGQLVKVVNWSE